MATGFAIPTLITKRVKTLNAGAVVNDVVYTCPDNCFTDVYLSHGINATLTNINLVRAGGSVSVVKQIAGAQGFGAGAHVILSNGGAVSESLNAGANSIVGTDTADVVASNTDGNSTKHGSVIRLFPNDMLVATYTGGVGNGELIYSTIEFFGQ